MYETSNADEICKCCNGKGTQMNLYTGLINYCPCCNGTGRRNGSSKVIITCESEYHDKIRR